jgi:hypothetical protein
MRDYALKAGLGILLLSSVVVPGGFARASGSASIEGLYPGDTVSIGTTVSFAVVTSGFSNPSYWVVDSFPGGVISSNINANGDLSWTPNEDDIGTHDLTITVSDASGDSAVVTQDIVVGSPSVSIQSLTPGTSVVVGNPVSFSVSASGFTNPYYSAADSFPYSSLLYSAINSAGNFSWTPIAQDIGNHTITLTIKDNFGDTATTSQQITVLSVPTIIIQSMIPGSSVGVGQTFSFVATSTGFIDPTYTVAESSTGLSSSTVAIDPSSGNATWVPLYNDIGLHQITVSATDSSGRTATKTFNITVTPQARGYVVSPVTTPVSVAPTVVSAPTSISATVTTGASPAYAFKHYLAVGSTGADVTALQETLTAQGVYTGPITGYFGQLTMHGVEKFQSSHGIESVGAVGPITRAALNGLGN